MCAEQQHSHDCLTAKQLLNMYFDHVLYVQYQVQYLAICSVVALREVSNHAAIVAVIILALSMLAACRTLDNKSMELSRATGTESL